MTLFSRGSHRYGIWVSAVRRGVEFTLTIDVMSRSDWETQNLYESRLSGQDPLARIHATPGYPLISMGGITVLLFGSSCMVTGRLSASTSVEMFLSPGEHRTRRCTHRCYTAGDAGVPLRSQSEANTPIPQARTASAVQCPFVSPSAKVGTSPRKKNRTKRRIANSVM